MLPTDITFVDFQETKKKYPGLTQSEIEQIVCKEYISVFLYGINGSDGRSPDYDDWELNGDIILFIEGKPFEISSMGIRVNRESLTRQMAESKKEWSQWHHNIDQYTQTIGGGIGQDRIAMLALKIPDIRTL